MTLKCKAVLIYWPSLGRFEALFLIQPWQQNFCPPAKSSTTYFSRVYLSCKATQERVPGAKNPRVYVSLPGRNPCVCLRIPTFICFGNFSYDSNST